MKLYIENGKLYQKTLFSTKEVNPKEILQVQVGDTMTTVHLKSGKKLEAKYALHLLFENVSFYEINNVSYEDQTYTGNAYTASELSKKLEQTRQKAQSEGSAIVKEKLGENYDLDVRIVGESYYSILVFRLVENGIVLEDHPAYEEIEELGVDKAIDEMDLSFLVKWDSTALSGLYGVTVEVENESSLEHYVKLCLENL